MIGMAFSIVLFFVSMFFLFKGALVTAAAIMGFSLLWYLSAYIYHKYDNMINYISNHGREEKTHEFGQ